ncbi:MAG: thiamine pyrophosphate-dependent enzyme [Prolixibacteraceae bacterium]|nr:thiamine pyrophosphate-dependent enzyme [Prolixibacteraceae bacterium]
MGQNQMMAARYYHFNTPNSLITSGGLGTMGFGLPAVVGAQVGQPDKTVVIFSGDGGFQMTVQELGAIFQHNLPVKTVILNNNFLGMVRQWQQLFNEKRYAHTDMPTPDFPLLANSYGIESRMVSSRNELIDGYKGTSCNPAGQAKYLEEENTQLNIAMGLCLGHDMIFNEKSAAPVTTLIVKERSNNVLNILNTILK